MTVLITGSAGFIGYHLAHRLLSRGDAVIGLDNLNSYYDPKLKKARLDRLEIAASQGGAPFFFSETNLEDTAAIEDIFQGKATNGSPIATGKPSKVVNLAAQAGVRYSTANPKAYISSNIVGFGNILEACRKNDITHLVYASSSSVYGGCTNLPFSENQPIESPLNLYAATKKSNELMAHAYSHLYNLPTTGIRFFTVYGPWGRPDMALFIFTKAILENKPIQIFNNGKLVRDFTYIDDIVEGLTRLLDKPPTDCATLDTTEVPFGASYIAAPYKVFNMGNSSPVPLMEYIHAIEEELGIKATKEYLPMQLGDMAATFADTSSLEEWISFRPCTPVRTGIANFIEWYRDFYRA